MTMQRKAFTLIELLIVVAIIAILAAIAVPNFVEAQTRSKVSRVKADLRTIATALESYAVDQNHYPWTGPTNTKFYPIGTTCVTLTTPIAYLTSVDFKDPFIGQGTPTGYTDGLIRTQYNYRNYEVFGTSNVSDSTYNPIKGVRAWCLNSLGPAHRVNSALNAEYSARQIPGFLPGDALYAIIYDPTNGTSSTGGITRTGGDTRFANR